jgi:hypothetical protein
MQPSIVPHRRCLAHIDQCQIAIDGTVQSWTKGFNIGIIRILGHAHDPTFPLVVGKVRKVFFRARVPRGINDGNGNVARTDGVAGEVFPGHENAQSGPRNGGGCEVETALVVALFRLARSVVVCARVDLRLHQRQRQ